MKKMVSLLKDESGGAVVEYALVAAFIAVAIMIGIGSLRTSLTGTYENIDNAVGQ